MICKFYLAKKKYYIYILILIIPLFYLNFVYFNFFIINYIITLRKNNVYNFFIIYKCEIKIEFVDLYNLKKII